MTPSDIFICFVALAAVFSLSFLPVRFSRFQLSLVVLLVFGVIVTGWLLAIRESQLAPHHIITSVNGRVMSDLVFTNNEIVMTGWRHEVTTNGYELVPYPVTNELWHIWSIFK